ncbi:hypothetical protein PRIPAC_87923 [Pristionchus pacificus]|uniref:Uncharacterized protein n=1 Tax=Pristionchus pacificus TaxID=54126 RepID=A0A2A6CWZ4_PRIPA|nr:hypothetical protein PRIPAC_87923 [Pristionchus pacificus]|eukprot:PDM82754.1 hypothetical protein PRIPAC_37147 [Pristionchus pacificus]
MSRSKTREANDILPARKSHRATSWRTWPGESAIRKAKNGDDGKMMDYDGPSWTIMDNHRGEWTRYKYAMGLAIAINYFFTLLHDVRFIDRIDDFIIGVAKCGATAAGKKKFDDVPFQGAIGQLSDLL